MDKNKSLIISAIKDSVFQTGWNAFIYSQSIVPVKTGDLKRSGDFSRELDGIQIKYKIHYAEIVERGWNGGNIWINSYSRSDGTFVRGHMKYQPKREGVHYIENALKRYFLEKVSSRSFFQDKVLQNLRASFPNKKITDF